MNFTAGNFVTTSEIESLGYIPLCDDPFFTAPKLFGTYTPLLFHLSISLLIREGNISPNFMLLLSIYAYIVYFKGMKIEQFKLFQNFKSCFQRIIEVGLNWSCCDISARVKVDTGAQTLVSLWTCKLEPFEANVSSVKWIQISSNEFTIVFLQFQTTKHLWQKQKKWATPVKCKPVFCFYGCGAWQVEALSGNPHLSTTPTT